MVTGESHYFQGSRYLLDVKDGVGRPGVRILGHKTLELRVPAACDRDHRDAVLQRWYRRQLRAQIPPLLAKWEPRAGVAVADVRIKRMKTRWGSCNAEARRIWLNLELVKKPAGCLEYVLVHEMVHLHERHHSERFQEWMEELMPMLAKWEPRAGVAVADVRIKRMKTRWGSCNAEARRIWLNLELVKKPAGCLEYVLVHEMVHLHERHHSERFQEWMEELMPTWRVQRDELNRAPLAHEDWKY